MSVYRGKNFCPFNNYTISASSSSTNQVVVQPADLTGGGINQVSATDVLISNAATTTAHVRWGTTTQTAVTTDFAVLAGETLVLDMGMTATNIAVILEGSGSGSVYISIGLGT